MVAVGLVARWNEHKSSTGDALDRGLHNVKLWRIYLVVGEVDGEKLCLILSSSAGL